MDKNKVLLKCLRNLSPLMSKLIDVAEKEQITIMTSENCCAYMGSIKRKDLIPTSSYNLGARECSDVGLGKVIIFSPEYLLTVFNEGSLGLLEFGFAHEIGHNSIWSLTPPCKKENSVCQYMEVMAYKLAVDIIRNLNGEKKFKLMYCGKPTPLKRILKVKKYPVIDAKDCDECASVLKLPEGCPKKEEIKSISKEILNKA